MTCTRLLFALSLLTSTAIATAKDALLPISATPLVNDQVIAMGFLDVHEIDNIANLFGVDARMLDRVKQVVDGFAKKSGIPIKRVYWLHNVEDLAGVPTIVVPWIADDKQRVIAADFAQLNQPFHLDRSAQPITHGVAILDAFVFGTERAVNGVRDAVATNRPDLVDRLSELSESNLAFVVSPGPSTRRVLRESFPVLPAPFHAITGPMLSNEIERLELSAKSNRKPLLDVRVVAASQETVAKVKQAFVAAIDLVESLSVDGNTRLNLLSVALGSFHRTTEGSTFALSIPDATTAKDFRKLTSTLAAQVINGNRNAQRMNDMRQLMLAIANHVSARSKFPAAVTVDSDGQPLLSWRVQVLPYLGELDLYKSFHLDEPWDSPHNRQFIDRIPAVFQPGDKPGHARLLAVEGKGLFMDGTQSRKIKEFRDGISKTIGIVHVDEASSVIWTKPGDWHPNASNPYQGLAMDTDGRIAAGLVDARTLRIVHGKNPQLFKATLTIDGGETTHLSKLMDD